MSEMPRLPPGVLQPSPASLFKLVLFGVGLLLFIIVGLTIMFGSWYTIDQTQRGVLLRNGAIVSVVQPGLNFKWPWMESVFKIDMQTHTHTYGFDKATNRDTMEAYSKDQQPAFLRVSVTLHVDPSKVQEVYSRFGGDLDAAIARTITPHVYERVKNVFGQYTAQRAISDRSQLNMETAKSIAEAIAYDPVFIIESAQIENISFSSGYIKSVEDRMMAEVEVQRLQQNLAREKVQADIALTQANGRANSVRAEALAEAERTKVLGDAAASAIRARAEALGSNPNLVLLTQAERWDGRLPATMLPGSAIPMIGIK